MKLVSLMAGSLLLTSVALAAEAPNAANGQKLFNASRCLECHGVDIFTRANRKVQNLPGLESVVRRCDANLSTNWFDDQILDVVAYLNKAYYKFEQPANQNATPDAKYGHVAIDNVENIENPDKKTGEAVAVVNAESE